MPAWVNRRARHLRACARVFATITGAFVRLRCASVKRLGHRSWFAKRRAHNQDIEFQQSDATWAHCHADRLTQNGRFADAGICHAVFAVLFLHSFKALIHRLEFAYIFPKGDQARLYGQERSNAQR